MPNDQVIIMYTGNTVRNDNFFRLTATDIGFFKYANKTTSHSGLVRSDEPRIKV